MLKCNKSHNSLAIFVNQCRVVAVIRGCELLFFKNIYSKLSIIKKGYKILLIILGTMLLLLLLAVAALRSSSVQNYLVDKAANYFSEYLGVEVSINTVGLKFFNKLLLEDVYMEDMQGDTLFYISELKAAIRPMPLLQRRLILTKVELTEAKARLAMGEDNVFNLKFLIDSLKNDKPKSKKNPMTFQIRDVQIINSQFSYDDNRFSRKAAGFDARHIQASNINADINLHNFDGTALLLDVNSFNLKEKSGFNLKNISFAFEADTAKATLSQLKVKLPASEITFGDVVANYGSMSNLRENIWGVDLCFDILPSQLTLSDLAAFAPSLRQLRKKAKISTSFRGSLSDMRLDNLLLSYNNSLTLRSNLSFSGAPDWKNAFINARIKEISSSKAGLQDLLSSILARPFILPKEFDNIGHLHYKGDVTGFFSDLVAYGELSSNLGLISMDLLLQFMPEFKGLDYSGSLKANELQPDKILGKETLLTNISFDISSKGKLREKEGISGSVEGKISELNFQNYTYQDFTLGGNFSKKGFDGKIEIDDPNAALDFNGTLDFSQEIPSGLFSLRVQHFNPDSLNLIKKQEGLSIAFNAQVDFAGMDVDHSNTKIIFDSIYLEKEDENVFIPKIEIESRVEEDTLDLFTLHSDLITGSARGKYSVLGLAKSAKEIFYTYMPVLQNKPNLSNNNSALNTKTNDFVFYFSDIKIDDLSHILNIPLAVDEKTAISGFYNEEKSKFHFELSSPNLSWAQNNLGNTHLLCNNPAQAIKLALNTQFNENTAVEILSKIENNKVDLDLNWDNPSVFTGNISTSNLFDRNEADSLQLTTNIAASQFKMKDTVWDIAKSSVETNFKRFKIDDFSISHAEQYLKITGIVSDLVNESILLHLNDIQLGYIMSLTQVKTVNLESRITGACRASALLGQMLIQMDILAKDFTFNKSLWGDVKVKSYWDNESKKILANGAVYTPTDTLVSIDGEYIPQQNYMDVSTEINGLPLDFLSEITKAAVQNVSGKAYGPLRIFGPLKQIAFDGDIEVKKGHVEVEMLGASFDFDDVISLRPTEIRFPKMTVYDKERNKATFEGYLQHQTFKNMRYSFTADCKNFLGLNTTETESDSFYGKAYATGTVRIAGDPSGSRFNIDVKTEPYTKIFIQLGQSNVATENSFIRFTSRKSEEKRIADSVRVASLNRNARRRNREMKSTMQLNLQVEATPDAEVVLITDPLNGDHLNARGAGNLRIEYTNTDQFKLFGNFEVERGAYVFTLQQVVRKNFSLRQGGNIRWSGDPTVAIIDLDAVYTVPSVSLLDIMDENQLQDVPRNVSVNCLLNLTGDLMQPTIKFDLELPSNPEMQRRIKNIVNTDEMMNREILALLLMGRFYSPDNLQANRASSGFANEAVSVLATTVSGQLNSWLSQLSGDKVNIGVNARIDGVDFSEGGEYKVDLMYQPNNRLVINSNLGYRNDVFSNSSNFIGDIDIEYKLTKSGKLRAKAYSHSADNLYYNTSGIVRTTQGVGFIYREDFDTFTELMRYYFKRNKTDTTSQYPDKINIESSEIKQKSDTIK